jgi:hypothetical protein
MRTDEQGYTPTRTDVVFPEIHGPRLSVLPCIVAGDRRYMLRGAFVVQLEHDTDGSVHASHRSLPLFGTGLSVADAMEAFAEYFDFQYRDLVECDESMLADDALAVRDQLLSLVREILPRATTDADRAE